MVSNRFQTPQAFDFAALLTEHRQNSDVLITDDNTLMEDADTLLRQLRATRFSPRSPPPRTLTTQRSLREG